MAGNFRDENEAVEIILLLDSGASHHLLKREDIFSDIAELEKPIKISVAKTSAFMTATKKGIILVTTNSGVDGVLYDVLYCPEVPHNLLSVRWIEDASLSALFD